MSNCLNGSTPCVCVRDIDAARCIGNCDMSRQTLSGLIYCGRLPIDDLNMIGTAVAEEQ
jgi:hypothetical protein